METRIQDRVISMTARLFGATAVVVACLQLQGCGALPTQSRVADRTDDLSPAMLVVETARQQVGVPYRYGGESPRGFDCSGLVHYAYARAGIEVPRTTRELLRHARRVPLSKLRPGDVLFFRVAPPKISHVGLYIGDGRFVHAPSSGKKVSYSSLNDYYWSRHVVAAGRFF